MITFSPEQTRFVCEICIDNAPYYSYSANELIHRLTLNSTNTVHLSDMELLMLWGEVRHMKNVGKWGKLRDNLIAKYHDRLDLA